MSFASIYEPENHANVPLMFDGLKFSEICTPSFDDFHEDLA